MLLNKTKWSDIMSNVKNDMCTSGTINKLITSAKKENKIFSACDNQVKNHFFILMGMIFI